jgi:alpha-glucosidase
MPQLQNLGLSGYAWVGVDIGGFTGDVTPELLTRWTELGIFQPFCRNHSAWDTRRQEPWAFGEPYESHMREMLLLRQRLLPYLYTLFEEAHRTGAPILRPLLFEYPDDEATYAADDEFLVGSALLVAPIAQPGIAHRHAYLPRGTWVQYWTGERITGPAHVLAHAPLGRPAIYVKANTPVPLWPAMEYASQHAPEPLTWLVYLAPDGEGTGVLYDDAGEGYAFEAGEFARQTVTCRASASGVQLELGAREGDWRPPHTTVELEIRGVAEPRRVSVDGVDVARRDALDTDSQEVAHWTSADGRLVVSTPASRDARSVTITL